jgi:predicted nuclease of predicted toxin-antitoxin system
VRAILDEQLSPQTAVLLRKAGHDVDAVADREDLVARSDRTILEVACREGRAVVTNNIKDFRPLAAEWLAQGKVHAGLILLPSTRTRSRHAIERSLPPLRPSFATIRTGSIAVNAGLARCRSCRASALRTAANRCEPRSAVSQSIVATRFRTPARPLPKAVRRYGVQTGAKWQRTASASCGQTRSRSLLRGG